MQRKMNQLNDKYGRDKIDGTGPNEGTVDT